MSPYKRPPRLPRGETYLGDGLYGSYDGWHVVLRAPNPTTTEGDDQLIFLEPPVIENLLKYLEQTHNVEITVSRPPLSQDDLG